MAKKRTQSGYYRFPTINEDRIYFVCEDDIWTTSIDGGRASRLTTGRGESSMPRVSPDGKSLAFVGREEGRPEIFVMDADGGLPRRLTYLGADTLSTVGWSYDGRHIYYVSDHHAPFFRASDAFAIEPGGGHSDCFNWGHVQSFSIKADGRVVLGRNNSDPARWKRYKGGTKGEIWVDDNGDGKFKPLINLNGNLVWPMWINNRVYFLSDHEGIGNIYSCTASGSDLQKHTAQSEYFVRFPSTDGERIVYTAGGDIFVFDPASNEERLVDVTAPVSTSQVQRKFVQARDHIDHYSPHPDGHSIALLSRGKPLTMGNWEGPCFDHSVGSSVRYRLCEWMPDGKNLVVVNDKDGFEKLEVIASDQSEESYFLTEEDMGRIISLRVSFDGKKVAFSNHKQELWIVDLDKNELFELDKSPAERITDFNWSYDSRYLAYSFASHPGLYNIRVANVESMEIHDVTEPVRADVAPSWDPDGNYLYFLGLRDFYPVMDSMSFDYGFPKGLRPYLITLRKDVRSPFVKEPKPVVARKSKKSDEIENNSTGEDAKQSSQSKNSKKHSNKELKKVYKKALSDAYNQLVKEFEKASENISAEKKEQQKSQSKGLEIDFDGIADRIISVPIGEGRYGDIVGVSGRVLMTLYPVTGIRPDFSWHDSDRVVANLIAYDFEEDRYAVIAKDVSELQLAHDGQTLYYRSKKKIRAIDAQEKLPAEGRSPSNPSSVGRDTGVIDLSRAQVLVKPQEEWSQMFDEAWRLQKEQFWDEAMSDIDWELVHERYSRLLPKLRSRAELSDLIWEMQGELGTSHAYEFGGDHRRSPTYRHGYLGADYKWDSKQKGYRIEKILKGDSWQRRSSSPLAAPGIGVSSGDCIVAINGQRFDQDLTIGELLLNQANKEVRLTIAEKGKKEKERDVVVETMSSERALRYRDWVESNRKYVHSKTKGRVGYVHIPDMGPMGFAEFHRSYLSEIHKEGLVVDVRYNRGGHVSSLLLEKLARKRVGYDVSRWGPPQPYPQESVAGPMVAITNEFAGSDGDIFSHCFKLFELGPLVGKRTWGGVIGIWPRHRLVDGTITTQPEFSFWFMDVGYGVENYGTDPDYEIDIAPHQFRKGEDPQMDKALNLILQETKAKPFSLPDFSERPKLTLPARSRLKAGRNGSQKNGSSLKNETGSRKATRKAKEVKSKRKRRVK